MGAIRSQQIAAPTRSAAPTVKRRNARHARISPPIEVARAGVEDCGLRKAGASAAKPLTIHSLGANPDKRADTRSIVMEWAIYSVIAWSSPGCEESGDSWASRVR